MYRSNLKNCETNQKVPDALREEVHSITNVWKVFAVLLEYCCRSDYRMLISEISSEHKKELDKMDADYQQKF